VHQNFLRENMGKVFTFLSQTILGLSLSDFTCGFKCFSEDAAKKVFSQMTINRWGFDSEILFLAHKFGYTIKEVPVVWKNEPNTKVKFPRDAIVSFSELVQIRWNDFSQKYAA
ncbi:MAG: glycosyltransferase family 2 protein, partial [Patescibacteria group bacterium]|nr:glycosyltransferase family 2 protein [Patescibacteria group bacterium]